MNLDSNIWTSATVFLQNLHRSWGSNLSVLDTYCIILHTLGRPTWDELGQTHLGEPERSRWVRGRGPRSGPSERKPLDEANEEQTKKRPPTSLVGQPSGMMNPFFLYNLRGLSTPLAVQ